MVVGDRDGAGSARVAQEGSDSVAWDGDDALDADLGVIVGRVVDDDLAALGDRVCAFTA